MSARLFDLARIGTGLPVAAAHAEIEDAVAEGVAVITAPPGTGKTTFVPPLLANFLAAGRGAGTRTSVGIGAGASSTTSPRPAPGRILLSQPRRVAVRAAARRLAALDGSAVGGPVGFTVRGERRVGPDTRIEVLTPGVLLRRLLSDPELEGVDAVVLDEVHERSVDGDLLLGFLAEVRELREDLTVIAMSATLDASGIAALLDAPVVNVPSPLHPLAITHRPGSHPRLDERGVTRDFLRHVAALAVTEQREAGHDALVFVPGAREVDEVVRGIRDLNPTGIDVLPLHGRLSPAEQDLAVSGGSAGGAARIVVSTSLAESSLTVPGVRLVIDSGLTREIRRDRGRDMSGLVTVSASRASVEQRAGRAARQGPGRAVRAYSETEFARMPPASAPEIQSADLLDAALLLAAWGTPGGTGLRLLTPPPAASMEQAQRELFALGLVSEEGGLTALGRRVSRLPVGVREARALLSGTAEIGDPDAVAEVVAALSGDFRDPGADLSRLLRALRSGRAPGAQRWRAEARRLARIAEDGRSGSGARAQPAPLPANTATHPADVPNDVAAHPANLRANTSAHPANVPGDVAAHPANLPANAATHPADLPGIITAIARPEWIARRTGEHSRSYLLASGTRAALPEGSELVSSEWIAVREVQRAEGRVADGTGAVIRLAAALGEADALRLGAPLRASERAARVQDGRVRVQERRTIGAIRLSSTPVAPTAADTAPAFAAHLRETGLDGLRWSEGAASLRARLGLLHRELGDPWPAMDDATLLATIDDWLGHDLESLTAQSSLHGIDLTQALRRLLPWPEAAQLDTLVPEHLEVPSGNRVRIRYPDAADFGVVTGGAEAEPAAANGAGTANSAPRPVVAVKLQELFGLAETPRLVGGRVPVLFHLLSPAQKPLAITGDLASFWNGPYQDVRKEMRGRYPKHPWPEDPWTAVATARTKRAMG
ncbi:DEAD/DEAH box helicase [Mycetocola lacteus]|uniref:DEAD/DEAH box helicase n=1 Tax=Mycetocola lacteus TaxID=76637 RepID=A0A3L7ARL8_9MICO|nr:ATP-dependent helicase C-terminal domain-containing protein [Mycetocola lacteus]RLP83057.1 DEAD/DEAH box helicase [Mycetocola lacteus]